MAIRNIRQEGDEILNKVSKPVVEIDDKIKILIQDMLETMHKQNGVGLAAVQVGVLKRVVVIHVNYEEEPIVLINPVIIKQKGKQVVEEGCLSFPNKFAKVERPEEIVVEAEDINGKKMKVIGKGLLAQALSHEIDHLEGEVFIKKILPGTLEIIT
ncbi:MAG: peptide deformylase [Clostridia bacterium]|nr:peptide deformylase [Clostridia bacterium]